jgi:hypothetical protein
MLDVSSDSLQVAVPLRDLNRRRFFETQLYTNCFGKNLDYDDELNLRWVQSAASTQPLLEVKKSASDLHRSN